MNKISDLYDILLTNYGYQNWWPLLKEKKCLYKAEFNKREKTEDEKFEICIGAILTQNTSWKNVEATLISLKEEGLLDFPSLDRISHSELSRRIKKAGYFNQKTKKIKYLLSFIKSELNGSIDALGDYGICTAREMLLSVWGIGKETADSILLYAFNMPVFVVDSYTRRIFFRLGIIDGDEEYDEIRELIEGSIPDDTSVYKEYHGLLVEHAKAHCRRKPYCMECPVSSICIFNEANN